MLSNQQVFIANGYLEVRDAASSPINLELDEIIASYKQNNDLITVVKNFIYYGYIPSWDAISALNSLDKKALTSFWKEAGGVLAELTATNRKMGDFVVYKNFPREVIAMSDAEYWTKQILMYFGFDKELFQQDEQPRDPIFEEVSLKVLHLANERTSPAIFDALLQSSSRWTPLQLSHTIYLLDSLEVSSFGMDEVRFRENGIQVVSHMLTKKVTDVRISDATDVLRLAALQSGGDVSLRTPSRFKSFTKSTRRFMCATLEASKNLEADVAERPKVWKRLFRTLHPGDFPKYEKVSQVYNEAYNGRLRSFASKVETGLQAKNSEVLALLASRPGEFARRLHQAYSIFGDDAVEKFTSVAHKLTTSQLLKILKYAETANKRNQFIYAPRGQWTKVQLALNSKTPFSEAALKRLRSDIGDILSRRLKKTFPEGCQIDTAVDKIKLQTNDQELASYGRGTAFPIPENMNFLRTASYWENTGRTSFFDNSWNFFTSAWQPAGTVCWNAARIGFGKETAAVFSGDPINSKDLKGRACQMVDLYIDKLLEKGIRYAVWNILSYNRITFDKVDGEVLATLQWGENAETGKLYEPSRAQMVFPLKGSVLTKYIAYVDLETRELIFIDANLPGRINSALANSHLLAERMPAFCEYLDSLPSVGDLFYHAEEGTIPVLYDDADTELEFGQKAYVFQPKNQNNGFVQIDLNKLLAEKD